MRLAILLISIWCLFIPITSIAGTVQAQHKIVEKFIELFRNDDIDISFGAMLISIDINNYKELEKYIRSTLKENDEKWATCIKLFVISRYTFEDDDAIYFIKSIPDDKENFEKLITFESSVLRHPGSHILSHLIYYTDKELQKPSINEIANKKIRNILPLADGWVGEFLEGMGQHISN